MVLNFQRSFGDFSEYINGGEGVIIGLCHEKELSSVY